MNLRTEVVRIINQYLNGTKISELPTGSALTGSELLECVQGGINIKITSSQLTGGGIPVTEFVQLTDVPNSYAGFGGYKVKVKADETGLEFVVDSGGGGGSVNSVNTGSGITIDNTDPTAPIVNLGGAINQDIEIYPNVDGNFGVYFGVNSGGTSYAAQAVISSRSFSSLGFTDGLGNFADINFSGSGITITAGGTADSILVQTPAIFADTVTLNADPTNPLEAATKQYVDSVAGGYSFSSPLSESGGTVSIQDAAADGTTKGAATFTANDFNASSGVISIDYTNGQAASGSTKGFLTSVDWTTFNNKLSGNQTITLSGDVTGSGATSITTTLATVNSNVGTFGSATQSVQFTVNGKGLITAASNVTVTPDVASITGLGTGVATFLGTPSWTNFNSMITGTAPFWNASGATTITTPTVTGDWTLVGGQTIQNDTLTTTTGNGLTLVNTTAASSGAQKVSPQTLWQGQGWKTTATAASQPVAFRAYVLPVQGTTNPSAIWRLESSINGGVFGNRVSLTSGGTFAVESGVLTVTNPSGSGSTLFSITKSALCFGIEQEGRTRWVGGGATLINQGFLDISGTTNFSGAGSGDHNSIAKILGTWTATGMDSTDLLSGIRLEPSWVVNSGQAPNIYGYLYNPTVSGAGTPNARYGFVSVSASDINGFGAGTTPANAIVVIGAGTTSLAPLKLTSGTNLTTAVAGCIEYNGTDFFGTKSGTTRGTILVSTVVTTEVVSSDTTLTITHNGTVYKLLARA